MSNRIFSFIMTPGRFRILPLKGRGYFEKEGLFLELMQKEKVYRDCQKGAQSRILANKTATQL